MNNLEREVNNVTDTTSFKEKFNRYKQWLHTLSWKKFILFSLLALMTSGITENLLGMQHEEGILVGITQIFILISIGVKALTIK